MGYVAYDIQLPFEYSRIKAYDNAIILVDSTRAWIIDRNNNRISNYYTDIDGICSNNSRELSRNSFKAKNSEGKWGIVDFSGKILVPFEYEHLGIEYDVFQLIGATKNGKTGFIDWNNNIRIPFKYDNWSHFCWHNGKILAVVEKDGENYYIDENDNRMY